VKEREEIGQAFDGDGSLSRAQDQVKRADSTVTLDTPSRSYYGGDGVLRMAQRYNYRTGGSHAGTFDEYRYVELCIDPAAETAVSVGQPVCEAPSADSAV
jgi:hypothetical protein